MTSAAGVPGIDESCAEGAEVLCIACRNAGVVAGGNPCDQNVGDVIVVMTLGIRLDTHLRRACRCSSIENEEATVQEFIPHVLPDLLQKTLFGAFWQSPDPEVDLVCRDRRCVNRGPFLVFRPGGHDWSGLWTHQLRKDIRVQYDHSEAFRRSHSGPSNSSHRCSESLREDRMASRLRSRINQSSSVKPSSWTRRVRASKLGSFCGYDLTGSGAEVSNAQISPSSVRPDDSARRRNLSATSGGKPEITSSSISRCSDQAGLHHSR